MKLSQQARNHSPSEKLFHSESLQLSYLVKHKVFKKRKKVALSVCKDNLLAINYRSIQIEMFCCFSS